MNRIILTLILVFGFWGNTMAEEPKVVGVLFYADWCTNCKVLEPKLTAIKQEFADQPIIYERIDLTDSTTRKVSFADAKKKGLGLIARRYGRATGHMVLVNAESKEVLGRIFSGQSKAQIRQKFRTALAR